MLHICYIGNIIVVFIETEELVKNHYLEDANTVFLKGAKGGLRGTDDIYDLLIEEDCKAGDHSNALTVAYQMEAYGRMATTFHFNCLLSVQVSLHFFLEYAGELCIIALRRKARYKRPPTPGKRGRRGNQKKG